MEPGAVVCRVSPSFIRFGTFQLPVSRGTDQHHLCETLMEYLQKRHFPELVDKPDANLKTLETIVERTAELVVKWQLMGFVHGVFILPSLCMYLNLVIVGHTCGILRLPLGACHEAGHCSV